MYESMSAQFRRRPIMHRQIRAKEREFMKDFTYTLGIDIGSDRKSTRLNSSH